MFGHEVLLGINLAQCLAQYRFLSPPPPRLSSMQHYLPMDVLLIPDFAGLFCRAE